jgi:hypothetical protein
VLRIAFNDGVSGTVDLFGRLAGPALEPLRDAALFAAVRVGAETIEWPNGVDWSPETLHEHVMAANGSRRRGNGAEFVDESSHAVGVREISRFYGIVITMFYDDHLPPRFHARLADESIAIAIDGDGIRGSLPSNRLALVFEWRDRHRDALRDNWHRMRQGAEPRPIPPLD